MPYELGTIWNVTSKYIYNTLDKNIGIGTTTPICELDVYCNIAENGIKLEDKYQLKPENNKKYDLIVREDREDREDLDQDDPQLIIWYKFNKDDFTSNFTSNNDNTIAYRRLIIEGTGTKSNLQKEYYVGTGSAEINNELYYKIEMTTSKFNSAQYTFCFWLFLNEECENNRYILNLKDTVFVPHTSIFHFKYNTDKLIIYKNDQTKIEYHYTLHKKKWHHISIIINNTTEPIILINGIKLITYTPTGNNIYLRDGNQKQNSADIYLGNTTGSINGYIDDFRIYQNNLPIDYIQNNIIGKITKITPGNISANGNYGIDIVNYSNNVNIGGPGPNDNVDLRIFGNLKVDGDLSITELVIDTSSFNTLNVTSNLTVGSNVNIHNDLTVSKTITENQRTLAQKYASISQIDKHTDIIISKMIDKEDVSTLYSTMPEFFQSNLILAYDFDFNIQDIDNPVDFFSNNILPELNTNTQPIYSTFSQYNIDPNRSKNAIDYYGTKYVKGNSSLYCGSNIFNSGGIDYYSFTALDTNQAYFSSSKSYTIAFWIRFNEIGRNQHIFNFGVPVNPLVPTEKSINISLNSNNNLNIDIINATISPSAISNIIDTFKFKKDEWYHIVLILKNGIDITSIPTDITNSNLLIQYFENLGYNDNTSSSSTYFDFTTPTNIATIFTYVNGIKVDDKTYASGVSIFGNSPTTFINYFGVLDSSTTTDYLNGYIDDFKMYQTVVPINYINEYIIGDALIIKPGLLSAIGNYGINIKNFTNIVSVGDCNNDVDLHIYGLLKIEDTKLTISNCDIDAIGTTLTTSNFEILETLTVSNINVSNIGIYDLISGPGFNLGSSNLINNIEITTLSNINLTSCNITANTITVNNELTLNNAILSNIIIFGIDIDQTFSISNDYITIRSNLIIGDNSCNDRRYDLGKVESSVITRIRDNDSNFINYYTNYNTDFPTITDTDTDDIQVFDKSIIFYGNTGTENYDIHFKNNYIRDEYCNIKEEIEKSYSVDRDRTRIKLDVGNISLQNGFIELIHQDILEDEPLSTLTIEENQISINSNHNATILSDSLMLSNTDNYCNCLLTNSNFMFNNGYGFINNETLSIKTIQIDEEIEIIKIITTNSIDSTFSIDTLSNSYLGKIRGFLSSNSKIDIDGEIKTNSNITASNITASNITTDDITINYTLNVSNINTSNITADDITINDTLNTSNIICDYEITFKEGSTNPTIINKNRIDVNFLHIYGGITLGQQTGSADNSINGGFGSLNIKTIKTTNNEDNDFSIDTLSNTYLGKIRGFLSSNSEIEIDGEIKTNSNITGSNITASNITADDITINYTLNVSNINTSNITADDITIIDTLNVSNIISDYLTGNTLYASNIQGIDGICSIIGRLHDNSEIDINCNIITTKDISCENQFTSNTLYAFNIQGIDGDLCSIEAKLENNSEIDINCNIITTQNIHCENQITSNILYASNIQGIDGDLCRIKGKLESNSEIDISGDIKTESNITTNRLYASYIDGPSGAAQCFIRGKLEGPSEIDISGDIKGTDLYINNIHAKDSGEILFNNHTNNTNITKCNNLKVHHISKLDSTNRIEIHNNIIIKSTDDEFRDNDPYIILTDSNITVYEETTNNYFKLEGNKISYKSDATIESDIIKYDAIDGLVIECDRLIVNKFEFNETQFAFDNIITYSRTTNLWPNIYIGQKTDASIRQQDRVNNEYLDVLYVDTPGNSRLKTDNILIQRKLSITDEDETSDMQFEITTKEAFTFFKNHTRDELVVFSLINKSIGINTKPPDNSPNIKLFVKDGGIQTTGDIIAFANISDKRFKMNITSFNNNDGIDIINKLNPVRFTWKSDLFNTKMANKDDIGFIAQEVAEIIPEAVAKCKIEMNEIDYNYINYERIIPYLVNNIKYLNNKIVELEDKLNGI